MTYNTNTPVYLAAGATDMRKSVDGLALIVSESFELDPFSGALFVFCNRSMNRLKILEWDCNGFWLHYKRLEKSRFKWPMEGDTIELTERELRWLLDGLDCLSTKGHSEVRERALI